MHEILFRGKTLTEKWAYGSLIHLDEEHNFIVPEYNRASTMSCAEIVTTLMEYVKSNTVCQFTGMQEFVVNDPSFRRKIFDGDIVEVWSRRRPISEPIILFRDKPTSQYDVECKVRATVCWNPINGVWKLNYDNSYNHNMETLLGQEGLKRTVEAGRYLYEYGISRDREDFYRQHNSRNKWRDIIVLGNIYDNPELLEVDTNHESR